jgi:hypothetical protein
MKVVTLDRALLNRYRSGRLVALKGGQPIRYLTPAESARLVAIRDDGSPVKATISGDAVDIITESNFLEMQLHAEHGSFILRWPSRVMARIVRNAVPDMAFLIPPASKCRCRHVLINNNPHPGHHHPLCDLANSRPSEAPTPHHYMTLEQEIINKLPHDKKYDIMARNELLLTLKANPSFPSMATAVTVDLDSVKTPKPVDLATFDHPVATVPRATPQSNVPLPESCQCRSWVGELAEPGVQHHVMCAHYEAWAATHPLKVLYVLTTLDGNPVREATVAEIQKAHHNVGKFITIQDVTYQVLRMSNVQVQERDREFIVPIPNDGKDGEFIVPLPNDEIDVMFDSDSASDVKTD